MLFNNKHSTRACGPGLQTLTTVKESVIQPASAGTETAGCDWVSVSQAWSHWPATSPEVKSDIRVTKLCFYINCRTNVSYWKTEWVASRLWLRRQMLLVTEVVMLILVKRSHPPAVFSWPGASIKNVNKIKNAVTASSRHTTRSLLYQNIKKVSHVQLVLLQECHSFILTSRVWSSVQVSAYQPVIMTVWTGPRDTTPQCTNYTCVLQGLSELQRQLTGMYNHLQVLGHWLMFSAWLLQNVHSTCSIIKLPSATMKQKIET